jgi:hypothetical protein
VFLLYQAYLYNIFDYGMRFLLEAVSQYISIAYFTLQIATLDQWNTATADLIKGDM